MTHHTCDYCGLIGSGAGYSPGDGQRFCCYGCYLVQRIIGSQGEEGIAAWIIVRLGLGAFLAMNVMMISMVLYFQSARELGESAVRGLNWAMLALSTPAMAILGGPFLLGAWRGLRRGRLSMDALIVTGSFAAYGISSANVIWNSGHVYFDTATMLLLIVTVGRLLEASAKNKTSQAIRELMDLAPSRAVVLRRGEEVDIPQSEVVTGDVMIVRPGERIPADGRIISGECMIEESAFTGESRPRACSASDTVFGGSINYDGLLRVEATAVGPDSLLSQIRRLVQQAQQERAPVERLAETVSAIFVPIVWLTALAAGLYWGYFRGDLERAGLSALAVLVVACPCALGIATPLATCIAIGRAARAGVLVRSGEILERLPSINRIFFDKTGTLTTNDLTVAQIVTEDGVSRESALAWTASLEAGSEHAIARAIVAAAHSEAISLGEVTGLRTIPGRGVTAKVTLDGDTKSVTAGSSALLAESHDIPDFLSATEDHDSLTTTYVGWDGRVRAAILLQDRTRPDAAAVVATLRAIGVRSAIISGDREGPTKRVAEELNIEDIYYECTPEEKIMTVQKAGCAGGNVAMVGDGINDAPALAAASVGIAIGGGTDIARHASDVTLLGDDLSRIPWLIELSKTTYRIIRRNLWWAFGYNSAAMVLAFLGYVHPLIAATAMVVSSLAVVANSMREGFRIQGEETSDE